MKKSSSLNLYLNLKNLKSFCGKKTLLTALGFIRTFSSNKFCSITFIRISHSWTGK